MSENMKRLYNESLKHGEEWRPHPYYSRIACSDKGRVATIKSARIIKLHESNGYLKASFRDGPGVKLIRFAHRLSAETFIGISSLQVNHMNGDKKDNNISNLEFVTPLQNTRHSIETGLRTNQSVRTVNAAFNEFKILTIASLFHAGAKRAEIARALGVGETAVNYLVNGKTYKEFSNLFIKSEAK